MCKICNNSITRDYTHCKNKHHLRLLMKQMKDKLESGYYFKPAWEKVKIHPDIR